MVGLHGGFGQTMLATMSSCALATLGRVGQVLDQLASEPVNWVASWARAAWEWSTQPTLTPAAPATVPTLAVIPATDSTAATPRTPAARLVALARDPWSLFAYWDVAANDRIAWLRRLGADAQDACEALRLTPVPDGEPHVIDLAPGATQRYVQVDQPGREWQVELGLRTRDGRFISWLNAAPVSTPPAGPSADTTVQWLAVPPRGAPVPTHRAWNGARVTPPSAAVEPLPASHVHTDT